MSKLVEGVVKAVKSSPYEIKSGPMAGPMMKHDISVESEDGSVVVVGKSTKPTTKFVLAEGTKVRVTYDEKSGTTKDGNSYTFRNVVKDGLVIFDSSGKEVASNKPAYSAGTGFKKDFGEGARNGMVIKAALDLAIANKVKDIGVKDLKIAANMVLELAKYVEGGQKEDAVPVKKEAVVVDNEDPFEE